MVTDLCRDIPTMTSQIWTGRGMVRLTAGGFLESYPSEDNAKEWDHKDHLALDICTGERFGKATVTDVVAITSYASNFS
jgi:hypothetical protein